MNSDPMLMVYVLGIIFFGSLAGISIIRLFVVVERKFWPGDE
jgi:hypothetical protein